MGCRSNEPIPVSLVSSCGGDAAVSVGCGLGSRGAPAHRRGDAVLRVRRLGRCGLQTRIY